jgi:hypothetical protein
MRFHLVALNLKSIISIFERNKISKSLNKSKTIQNYKLTIEFSANEHLSNISAAAVFKLTHSANEKPKRRLKL